MKMQKKSMIGKKGKIAIGTAGILGVFAAALILAAGRADSRFASGTELGSKDVSDMTVQELKRDINNYTLKVVYLDNNGDSLEEVIFGKDFGIHMEEDKAREVLEEQGVLQYLSGQGKKYSNGDWFRYDEERLSEAVGKLSCFDASRFEAPKNAYISEYDDKKGYQIVEETKGNIIDEGKAHKIIVDAVSNMEEKVDLSEKDCYQEAEITAENKKLNQTLKQMNTYAGAKITYRFGSKKEVVDGKLISQWIRVNKKGKVALIKKKIENYVAALRRKYDTIFQSRKFKTSYGKTVTVSGGDYGWWMNCRQEEKKLAKLIRAGKKVERTPEYYQTAQSYGKNDYGDSYVEINLTAQHLFLYDKGKKILETDCVTGNSARGFDTPAGTYSITYTERNATLQGENYSTPVKYWMPFNGNIGMHDADWRSSFGGETYKYNGSHGCVNLPPNMAAKIFKYVKKGTPVFCYKLAVKKKEEKPEKKNQNISTAASRKSADTTKRNNPGANTSKKKSNTSNKNNPDANTGKKKSNTSNKNKAGTNSSKKKDNTSNKNKAGTNSSKKKNNTSNKNKAGANTGKKKNATVNKSKSTTNISRN